MVTRYSIYSAQLMSIRAIKRTQKSFRMCNLSVNMTGILKSNPNKPDIVTNKIPVKI